MTKRERDIQRINLVGGTIIFFLLALIIYFVFTCNSNKEDISKLPNKDIKPDTAIKIDSGKNSIKQPPDTPQLQDNDAYHIMHENFVGRPPKTEIQPMMEVVMERHKSEVNENNLLRFANVLVALRKSSKAGVTEMEILKHMFEHGEAVNSFQVQAAMSKSQLERAKQ